MAKRNKAEAPEDAEEYQFIPPEFDEDQFIHKEMVSFHTTVILFVAGILAALASWGAFTAMDGAKVGWLVGMVILAITFAFLRPIFRLLKVDIAHWARREWFGTGFLMFFTWLAFFIMFVNPPVSDFASPEGNLYLSPGAPIAGEDVTFDLFLHDNAGIDGYDMQLMRLGGTIDTPSLARINAHHYQETVQLPAGDYSWHVTVRDTNGLTSDVWHNFTVGTGIAVTVDATKDFPVQVRTPAGLNIWGVYATVDSGERVYLEEDEKVGAWVATGNFEGWHTGLNNFTITVEEKNRFDGQTLIRGAQVTKGPYQLEVAAPGDYDKGTPKRANPTVAPEVNIPGFDAVWLVAGLVAVAFVARRRS